MTPEEKQKLNEVYEFMQALKNSTTIPFEVDRAFRDRFRDILLLEVSSKGVDTEDVTIDAGSINVYTAMDDPDGFIQTTLSGTTYYIPYFSS